MNMMAKCILRYCSLLLLACPLLASCVRDDKAPEVREYVRVGDSLPRFSVTLTDGTRVDNATWAGRTLVLVLFSIDCSDCKRKLPQVERFFQMVKGRDDIYTLGISRAGGHEAVTSYWRDNGLTFPCSPQEDRRVYDLFASAIVPRIYVVSPWGKVTAMFDDTNMPSAETLLRLAEN